MLLSIILTISTMIFVAWSNLDCQYFQYYSGLQTFGPLYPTDVCMQIRQYDPYDPSRIITSSYEYKCGGFKEYVWIYYYHNQPKCKGFATTKELLLTPAINCGPRATCDHVIVRKYQTATDVCKPNEEDLYIENAFAVGCWNFALGNHQYSGELTCEGESFTLAEYHSTGCTGELASNQTINTGCDWFKNSTIPPISNATTTMAPGGNNTYFKITECGNNPVPAWVYVVGALVVFCCCAGCIGGCCYCVKQRKDGINTGYVQTYQ